MGSALREKARLISAAALVAVSLTAQPLRAVDYEATSHRRFANPENWTRVFDDPHRAEWQKPEEVVRALALAPGMRVADIGAGTGYFSARLSAAVGESGTVFAVEVEPNLVAYLRDRADKENTRNVVPVLASAANPRLPAGIIDLALFVDAYHHVDDRARDLQTLQSSLAPTGRIAIVEWKPGKLPVGPPEEEHKIPREQLVRELEGAGFELVSAPDILPYQWMLIFGRRAVPKN
jgi:SAM-dependent methyltransferase